MTDEELKKLADEAAAFGHCDSIGLRALLQVVRATERERAAVVCVNLRGVALDANEDWCKGYHGALQAAAAAIRRGDT